MGAAGRSAIMARMLSLITLLRISSMSLTDAPFGAIAAVLKRTRGTSPPVRPAALIFGDTPDVAVHAMSHRAETGVQW